MRKAGINSKEDTKMDKPYKAVERNGYYVVVDSRNGNLASYPTTRGTARSFARLMNDEYVRAIAA